jgi:hypothetical protein
MVKPSQNQLSPEKYARLRAEAKAPYKGLRQFLYLGLGLSASIGAGIFFLQFLAGRDSIAILPNLGLQVGVAALMFWLFRREAR